MQETAKDICHPHGDSRSEQFHAKYTLRDGTGSLKIVITIIESTINDVGVPDPRPRAFYPDGFDWSSLHFARDVACVTEEMITKLIAGAKENSSERITEKVEQTYLKGKQLGCFLGSKSHQLCPALGEFYSRSLWGGIYGRSEVKWVPLIRRVCILVGCPNTCYFYRAPHGHLLVQDGSAKPFM
ncbi:hypothetical protein, conserved [Eimeria acervulina]|uniref:Uncharacterized protein n=1 Tax=Eimeria acervulina TaxID=5801 RepID=U6GNH2_EIMAC|nr:hypothetical protein, conserved [Eimeria acervulina]CDI80833.1 hypothetical protein, conserved [Eimeria acervulina]